MKGCRGHGKDHVIFLFCHPDDSKSCMTDLRQLIWKDRIVLGWATHLDGQLISTMLYSDAE